MFTRKPELLEIFTDFEAHVLVSQADNRALQWLLREVTNADGIHQSFNRVVHKTFSYCTQVARMVKSRPAH